MTQVNGTTPATGSPTRPSAPVPPTPAMSPADTAAHQAASYTRPTPAAIPALARCTGNCTTTTHQPTTPDWTRDKWGWLCPAHTHARTDQPTPGTAARCATPATTPPTRYQPPAVTFVLPVIHRSL